MCAGGEEEVPSTPKAERRPSSVPQSPFGWAAELGEGIFGRFKSGNIEQTPRGEKGGGFNIKSLF
jgi:hypothetical protein